MTITLEGIEQAVSGLKYRKTKSLKSKLIHAIKRHYEAEGALESIQSIEAETLIRQLWNIGDDANALRLKRINFSVMKSSVNVDLEKAWDRGENPEGITIGSRNTFVMCDAAKDKLLNSLSDALNDREDWMEQLGLPVDMLDTEDVDFENVILDLKKQKLLAEQFDGFLGVMERHYNQYLLAPAGNYKIGRADTDADVLKEKTITQTDFYMGKYPVTNALFEIFIERTGYTTTAEKLGFGYVYAGRFQRFDDPKTGQQRSVWNAASVRKKVDGAAWFQPFGPGSNLHNKRNHPVVQISLRDAFAFAAWAGKRLPTEVEWEAAARTQTGELYPWGDTWKTECCNIETSAISDTSPVDEYPEGINTFGLADMIGNVLEWTSDECSPKYPLENAPKYYVARGGSWISNDRITLCDRTRLPMDFTSNILGMRCLAD
ncbi:MAG: SUMF1/EgtB/PvdO family nonheme iron enzyme [Deltaproteobacteria bacterium]|nr:SUMF1/EgtB/PvdO family nonheme iron enzyme [Deltaproteobacteria bacterium]